MNHRKTSTSKGAGAKIERAINQLENARMLLAGLPKYIWKKKKKEIEQLIYEVDDITEKTRSKLADEIQKKE